MNSDVPSDRRGNYFRPDIEGLRGVAVLIVVGCHCGISWCAGGFVGVDVFFVLSGYLITGLLAAEYRATSRIDLLRFYARRARRLLPVFVLVLVATTLFAAAVFAPQEIAFTARAARWAGLYVSNVFFDRTASNYFAPNMEGNPLLHTWSLGIEEQFYLVWPLLILAAARGPNSARRSIWILSAVTVLSFTCCVCATRLAPTVAFYELPSRSWEFAAGGLLAFLPRSKSLGGRPLETVCGVLGIALILGTSVLIKGGADFPGWIALFPAVGALATLFAGARAPRYGVSLVLGGAPLQFLGSRSYAWYLWHWPFIVFAEALSPGITVGGKVLAAIASLLAATFTLSFVERPIRENHRLGARPLLSLGLAAGATLLTVGASWALMLYGQRVGIDSTFRSFIAAQTDIADLSIKACVSQGHSVEVKVCNFGASSAQRAVVLFGDSHALQWFNAFRTAANMEAWRVITVMKFGCAASDINPHRLPDAKDECKEWRRQAIAKIIAIRPAAVVMASYTGSTIRGFRTEVPMPAEELRLGTRRTLEKLSGAGIPTVVLRDTPLPPSDIITCIGRNLVKKPHGAALCDFDASGAQDEAAFSAEQLAADGLPNTYYLDLSDLICRRGSCTAVQNGILVYYDDNHLTGAFAESVAPIVRTRLFQLLRKAQ